MCNNPVFHRINGEYQLIPCGNCLGCRIDHTVLWQARCNSEYIRYRSAFVTFTYDDFHLLYNDNALLPTLRKEQFHKYLDNLRHKVKKIPFMPKGTIRDFKYFGCGEYGDSFSSSLSHFILRS